MFNIILKQIFHFTTFPTISFLYDSDDNLSERMEGVITEKKGTHPITPLPQKTCPEHCSGL